MKKWRDIVLLFLSFCPMAGVMAGEIVVVEDPRYFERQKQVIFPHAEVKLVAFEFETVGESESGKQRARELHSQFLSRIRDLRGGAIITYVTPPGQQIENYRVEAESVAIQQQAQMVLWGRILLDRSDVPLINARLMLIEAPPGVSATYSREAETDDGPLVRVKGVIDAPVTQTRVDFNTMEKDVMPLAWFLSGLARYYKGAAREGAQAGSWLRSCIDDFSSYIGQVSEELDRSALAQANLYLARAYIRLAEVEASGAPDLIEQAHTHASEAARLNPYDPSVPTVQAVVAVKRNADAATIRSHLAQAVRLAPADGNMRVNLAVMDGAAGKVEDALRHLDKASFIQKVQQNEPSPAIQQLREELQEYHKNR